MELMNRQQTIGLIMIGAGRRLTIAAFIAMALWAGFFWAITPAGGL